MPALSDCAPLRPRISWQQPIPSADPCVASAPDGRAGPHRVGSAAASALALVAACGLLLEIVASPVALAQAELAGLQCRLGGGPWQSCRLEVQDIGLRWVLRIGEQRIEFRHSGDGAVRMQKGSGPWQSVTATWQPDTSLCWDGVCAKGDIPLD